MFAEGERHFNCDITQCFCDFAVLRSLKTDTIINKKKQTNHPQTADPSVAGEAAEGEVNANPQNT